MEATNPEYVIRSVELSSAKVRISRYLYTETLEAAGAFDAYRLDFCLTRRPQDIRACFRDVWGRHRFEPVGDICLLPPDQFVHVRGEHAASSLVCIVSREAIETWLGGKPEWSQSAILDAINIRNRHLRYSLQRLVQEVEHPGLASAEVCEALTTQIIVDLCRHIGGSRLEREKGGLSARHLKLIDERLAEPAAVQGLSELAQLCGLSVRQLTRGFRASRGCSIGEYVRHMRVNMAKDLLLKTASIKSVAYELGFSSPGNFSTLFQRATGETPRQFIARTRN